MKAQGRNILLVLFFAGLVGLWWAERANVPDRAKRLLMEPRVLPELVDTRPDELRRIEILGADEPIVLERRGPDRWMLVRPLEVGADPGIVETLALNLKTLAKSPGAGAIAIGEATGLGLAPPARTVKLWGTATDKPIATLEVGKVARDNRYVRNADGGLIEVVEARLLSALDLSPKAWRDRSLFHIPSFQVESIETARKEGPMVLRRERDRWRIEKPWHAPADATAIEGALASLTSLRAIPGDAGFAAQSVKDFSPYGLDAPLMTVTLAGGQGRDRQRISIGKAAPKPADSGSAPATSELRYARREDDGEVLIVDARPFIELGRSPVTLRSKLVGQIERERVDFVAMKTGNEEVALARSPRGWARILPTLDQADNQAVFELVKSVLELQAAEILDPKTVPDSGIDPPQTVIRIWQDTAETRSVGAEPDSAPSLTLRVGKRDAARRSVYIQVGDEPYLMAVPDTFLASLPRSALAFKTRQILALASNLVDRLALEGGPRRYVVQAPAKPSAKGWKLTVPVNAPADTDTLSQMLLLLGNLRVESFVTEKPKDLATYGLDKPWRMVTWTLRPEPGAKDRSPLEGSLSVGKLTESGRGSRYARLGSSETIFTLSPEQMLPLDSEWRDRRVLGVQGERVEGLRIQWRDVKLSVIANKDRGTSQRNWVINAPVAGIDFDSGKVPELLAALTNLQAVKFVQLDGAIPAETGLGAPRLTLRIYSSECELARVLKIGGVSPDGYFYATTSAAEAGPVFLLPLASWEPWIQSPSRKLKAALVLPGTNPQAGKP